MQRKRVIVSGRVQGVGYRYFCLDEASALGLSGWARNLRDGDVEIEVQGEGRNLDDFLRKLSQGPVLSRVADVKEEDMPALEGETGFSIRH